MGYGKPKDSTSPVLNLESGTAVHCHISGEQIEQSKNRVQFGAELAEIPHTLSTINKGVV